jgi:nicotinamidase-related amidase
MAIKLAASDALLVVDPQVDFCPGGALPVPGGDRIFEAVNRVAPRFAHVVASRDWHPAGHVSFSERGGSWPAHCVMGTPGSEFHPRLDQGPIEHVVSKGSDPDRESYSAFEGTDLEEWLRDRGVRRVIVAGLATDYCVRASALDARQAGFEVVVLEDAVGAVEAAPGDGTRALDEMRRAGATLARSSELQGG